MTPEQKIKWENWFYKKREVAFASHTLTADTFLEAIELALEEGAEAKEESVKEAYAESTLKDMNDLMLAKAVKRLVKAFENKHEN